jgi:divalent metal cation (Fe/Co/Zn/Cd) transporter
MGSFIFIDSTITLLKGEHPTIGTVNLLGREIWLGWAMIVVLLYSFLPAMILGRKKVPYAKSLHIKLLFVDSQAQKADWMTGAASIIGIGFGLWWADAVAAIFIALNILRDGWKRSKDAMMDLMEEIPHTYDNKNKHPVLIQIVEVALSQPWVSAVEIRFREHGMVFFGDMFVIPKTQENLVANIDSLYQNIKALRWHIEDLVIHPVANFPNPNVLYKKKDKEDVVVKRNI